jgi:hypothetical protein
MFAAALVSLGSPGGRAAGAALLGAAAAVGLAAGAGVPARGRVGRLYYFAVINLAVACGVAAGLFGYSRPAWKTVARA